MALYGPAVTQESFVAPWEEIAADPNGHQWTPQSHLEAWPDHRFSRGPPRAHSCAACDPDLSKAHPKSGRLTHRSRCPLRAQATQLMRDAK